MGADSDAEPPAIALSAVLSDEEKAASLTHAAYFFLGCAAKPEGNVALVLQTEAVTQKPVLTNVLDIRGGDGIVHVERAHEVLLELFGSEVEDQTMEVAVTADLVSGARDLLHELGIALGHPAHRHEGRLRSVVVEDPE